MTHLTRRDMLAAGTGFATLAAAAAAPPASHSTPARAPQPPFDTLRDYVAALEANGLLLRIPEIDQDAYRATGLVYRANDLYGFTGVPALLFERVKINGQWVKGPLRGLLQANLYSDAIVFGELLVPGDSKASYRKVKARLAEVLKQNKGSFPQIPPVTVPRERALCKQIVLRGEDIDLTKFAFIQTNPMDAGRYVNATSVFTHDPVLGNNFGTYRCQHAHLSKRLAKAGDVVLSGGNIGRVGSTGRATGPHLHFEVRQNGAPLNPVRFLRLPS